MLPKPLISALHSASGGSVIIFTWGARGNASGRMVLRIGLILVGERRFLPNSFKRVPDLSALCADCIQILPEKVPPWARSLIYRRG